MNAPPSEDPFVSVQKEVQNNWEAISEEFEQWKVKVSDGTMPTRSSRELLENKLHTIEWDIQDLHEAVRIAKQDPAKYNLLPSHVSARERFVSDMARNVQFVRAALVASVEDTPEGPNVTTRYAGKRDELLGDRQAAKEEMREANDSFIDDQMMQQEQIMQQQDDDLDHLSSAVERIGLMGHDMHQGLAEQGQLLDDLGDEMDSAQTRMANVRQKLDKFIAETGPKQFCTIVGLSVTFLVLTVLVATT